MSPERSADPGTRFGEPVELPWWTVPVALPPLVALVLGLVLRAPISGRLVDLIGSGLLLMVVYVVAQRVESRNMQSVWISTGYAFWFFAVLIWAVEVAAG